MNCRPSVRSRSSAAIVLAVAAACAGCSSGASASGATSSFSVIQGQVDSSSFHSNVGGLIAQNEDGASFAAALDASGTFSLSLPSGHQYKLTVETQEGPANLIFPRSDRVDEAFALDSDDAIIPLGTIRLLGGDSVALDSPAACPDGLTANGQPCTVASSLVRCVGGYSSSPGSCDDISVVLDYGTLASAIAAVPAGTLLALPGMEPPCEVVGCDLPDTGNPPQGPSGD
jgi:hypothetical protein